MYLLIFFKPVHYLSIMYMYFKIVNGTNIPMYIQLFSLQDEYVSKLEKILKKTKDHKSM